MEQDLARMYAMQLQKRLRSGNYENYGNRSMNNEGLPMQLQIEPSFNEAPINIDQSFIPVSGMLPQGSYTGEIAFRVVRETSKISAPLPIPFGSAFAFSQNYIPVIESLLPNGVQLTSVTISVELNKMTIVYTNGVDTDNVVIYGDTYNYLTFNQGLYTRKAITNVIRYTVPDNSAVYTQVSSTPSRPFRASWLSNVQIDRNTLTLTPMQYNKNVFDIVAPTEISEEKGFALYAFGNTAAPTVALTNTVQMFFSVIGKV